MFFVDELLLACEHGQADIVEYLLSDLNISPNIKSDNERTPLSVAKGKEVVRLLLQHGVVAKDAYTYHRRALGNIFSTEPLKSPVKMLVVGHSGEGKSTLIESLKQEPRRFASIVSVFTSPNKIDGVSQHTAGIIPQIFNSRFYGKLLIYDFAGQDAYYSSHAAVIRSVVDECPPIYVLVIGLHRDEILVIQSVVYWLGVLTNQCANIKDTVPLIVVGSHIDHVKERSEIQSKKLIISQTAARFTLFNLVDIIPTDCRYANSDSLRLLRQLVGACCQPVQTTPSVSVNSHMFLIYLHRKHSDKIAVTLEMIHTDLEATEKHEKMEEVMRFIPTTLGHLHEICIQLNDKGHILFLLNKSNPQKSYIVLNKTALLADINGTVFAPEDFKQHCKLSSSTGIVLQSELAKRFPQYNVDLLTKFLSYLELAVPVEDKEVLSLINKRIKSTTHLTLEAYLFCPGLIRLDVPSEIFKQVSDFRYHFGWTLCCSEPDNFFDARFLHVLILRIALSFSLTYELVADTPSLHCQCSVWKTGVCWCTRFGAKVLVEVINKKQVIVLIQAYTYSFELLYLKYTVIHKIKKTANDFCPSVITEEMLIAPADVNYPLKTAAKFSIKSIAQSIVSQDPYVISVSNIQMLPVCELLPVEVYANLGEYTLQLIFNENDPIHDKIVSDQHLSVLASSWKKNKDLVAIIKVCLATALERQSIAESNIDMIFKSWRDSSQGTFRDLRQMLDALSVFSGRNPLVCFKKIIFGYNDCMVYSNNNLNFVTMVYKIHLLLNISA